MCPTQREPPPAIDHDDNVVDDDDDVVDDDDNVVDDDDDVVDDDNDDVEGHDSENDDDGEASDLETWRPPNYLQLRCPSISSRGRAGCKSPGRQQVRRISTKNN